jgi:protocatechuate 3,4-dioxygenase beta subunit
VIRTGLLVDILKLIHQQNKREGRLMFLQGFAGRFADFANAVFCFANNRLLDLPRALSIRSSRRMIVNLIAISLAATCFAGMPAFGDNKPDLEPKESGSPGEKLGRVVDTNGKGVANAILLENKYSGSEDDNPAWTTTTDSKGRFSFPELHSDRMDPFSHSSITFAISASGFMTGPNQSIHVNPNGKYIPENLTFLLVRVGRLSGKVLGPDGKPLARAPLTLDAHWNISIYAKGGGSNGNAGNRLLTAITDKEGKFTFDNLPPGVHLLLYPWSGPTAEDEKSGRWKEYQDPKLNWPQIPIIEGVHGAEIVEMEEGQNVDDLILDLSKSKCIVEGRVFGPDGKPLTGGSVSIARYYSNVPPAKRHNVIPLGDDLPRLFWPMPIEFTDGAWDVTTDSDGRYKIENVPPGKWMLLAKHPHFQRQGYIGNGMNSIGKTEWAVLEKTGQTVTQDLRVFERYEPEENISSEKRAIEKSETMSFSFMDIMQNLVGFPPNDDVHSMRFLDLSIVNRSCVKFINVYELNLPPNPTPEQVAEAAHAGEVYFAEPDQLVGVNGTTLAPVILPPSLPKNENVVRSDLMELIDRLSRLTRLELAKQIKSSGRNNIDGRRISVKSNQFYVAVRDDGKAFLLFVRSVQKKSVSLSALYIGRLAIETEKTESNDAKASQEKADGSQP